MWITMSHMRVCDSSVSGVAADLSESCRDSPSSEQPAGASSPNQKPLLTRAPLNLYTALSATASPRRSWARARVGGLGVGLDVCLC